MATELEHEEEKCSCLGRCSLPYLLSPLLVFWGLSVMGLSLVTLAFTTSYRAVFPFFSPIWTSMLFLLTGSFLLFTYKISAPSNKSHVWLCLFLGVLGTFESVLALVVSLWRYLIMSPILPLCSPDPSLVGRGSLTCECTEGFINPPSLIRTVYRFEGVDDCEALGGSLRVFYNILTGLYTLGIVLAVLLCIGASKRLHTLGVWVDSGVYTVTPAASKPATSRQASPDPLASFTGPPSSITGGASHRSPGPASRPPVTRHLVVGSRHRLTSTGSTYQSAMI